MSLYFRRSKTIGGVRFNFSNSGVSTSVGRRGVHVTRSKRGTYLSLGYAGFRYRTRIDKPKAVVRQVASAPQGAETIIDSGPLDSVGSRDELLDAVRSSLGRVQIGRLAFWLGLGILILIPSWTRGLTHANTLFGMYLGLWLIGTIAITALDRKRRTINLEGHLDEKAKEPCEAFVAASKGVVASNNVWKVSASVEVLDKRHNAGASANLRRVTARVALAPPKFIKTNLTITSFFVGKKSLHFFPDRLLLIEGKKAACFPLADINIVAGTDRFIEEGVRPKDSQVIDTTWRYVNKNGSPDRRMKDNRELPIMLYGTIALTSETGLNELFQVSHADSAQTFCAALNDLKVFCQHLPDHPSEVN